MRELARQLPLADYLVPAEDDPYPRGVAEAILLSVDAVTAADHTGLCAPLLSLIALLSPVGVTRDLLHTAGSVGALSTAPAPRFFRRWRANKPVDKQLIDDALGRLARATLLAFSEDGTTVTAHRLVTRVIRERSALRATLPDLATRACALLKAVQGSLRGCTQATRWMP
jgi:hypothetical protein